MLPWNASISLANIAEYDKLKEGEDSVFRRLGQRSNYYKKVKRTK